MKRFILLCLLSLLGAVRVMAHQNPRGEIRPNVFADADGNFGVFFDHMGSGFRQPMSLLLAADGTELIPRHRLSASALLAFGIRDSEDGMIIDFSAPTSSGKATESCQILSRPAGKVAEELVLLESGPSWPEPRQARRLPFPPLKVEMLAEYAAGPQSRWIALLTSGYQTDPGDVSIKMTLHCCLRQPGHGSGLEAWENAAVQIQLTHVGAIYDFPTTSPPVWAENRFWIAWVRQLGRDEAATWTTMLTGLDPLTGIAETHSLPGISNWNTRVSLAVNSSGTLCAAWAPSTDGTYPGQARIVTAVFPLRHPRPPLRP